MNLKRRRRRSWKRPFLILDALSVISFTVAKWISLLQWEAQKFPATTPMTTTTLEQRQQQQQHTKTRIPITLHIARKTLENAYYYLSSNDWMRWGWGWACAIHSFNGIICTLLFLLLFLTLAVYLFLWISFCLAPSVSHIKFKQTTEKFV